MRKKILISVIILLLFSTNVFCKIIAPKEVEPVIYKNLTIIADHENPGYVFVYDNSSDTLLWKKRIYRYFIYPFLEKDVQLVFIIKMELINSIIEITNSKKVIYMLNLETKKVKKKK